VSSTYALSSAPLSKFWQLSDFGNFASEPGFSRVGMEARFWLAGTQCSEARKKSAEGFKTDHTDRESGLGNYSGGHLRHASFAIADCL
jgi:hypothetical protein